MRWHAAGEPTLQSTMKRRMKSTLLSKVGSMRGPPGTPGMWMPFSSTPRAVATLLGSATTILRNARAVSRCEAREQEARCAARCAPGNSTASAGAQPPRASHTPPAFDDCSLPRPYGPAHTARSVGEAAEKEHAPHVQRLAERLHVVRRQRCGHSRVKVGLEAVYMRANAVACGGE